MDNIKRKNIKEICKEIDLIIDGSHNKTDYQFIYSHLDNALNKNLSYSQIELICETIIKIAETKNRILRYLEKDFWDFILKVPNVFLSGISSDEDEELLPDTEYDNESKKILSRLIGLPQEILKIKDDNSKGSGVRRVGAIRLIADLTDYYHIPFAKELFIDSLNNKNENERYAALQGIQNYYNVTDEEIDEDIVQRLELIKDETNDSSVMFTCLQIQIDAGILDQTSALFELEDWKEDHI